MRIASRCDRFSEPGSQPFDELFGAVSVFRDILAIEIKKIKLGEQFFRQFGNMSALPEGVSRSDENRILPKQLCQTGKGKKASGSFIAFQSGVQLEDGFRGTDGKYMSCLLYTSRCV